MRTERFYNTKIKVIASLLYVLTVFFNTASANAEVVRVRVANVSPQSISLAWVNEEAVLNASVKVYSDQNATSQITAGIVQEIKNSQSLGLGLVQVQLSGLMADTEYFFQLDTTTSAGLSTYPSIGAGMATVTSKSVDLGSQLDPGFAKNNDSVVVKLSALDLPAITNGMLTFVEIPHSGQIPLAAFVGSGEFNEAVHDLNNIFDAAGRSYEVPDNTPLKISLWRGLACAGEDTHQEKVFYRRTKVHDEPVRVASGNQGQTCFAADTVCDGVINVLDFQFIVNSLGSIQGECAYSPYLDINLDHQVDALDYQYSIDRLDDVEPFE